MTARHELRALTGMRGLAAWMVVLYHIRLSIAGLPMAVEHVLARGYLAVDFFFLLSGFVIWLSWGPRLHDAGWRAVPLFLQRRIARIWPLHAVILAGAVALALLLAATGRADPVRFPFGELPLHILLVQNWGFTERLSWNDPAWSISCELAAYLAFPLLVMLVDWRRWSSAGLVAIVVILLASLHLAMAGAPTLGTDIAHYGLIRCLVEFAAGGVVCALWTRWRDHGWIAAAGAFAMGAALLTSWDCGVPETLAVPGAFAAILLGLALTSDAPGNPLGMPALHYLGEISYATYLSHFLLFFVVKLALVRDAHAVPPVTIATYLALTLVASVALYHLVERPAQRRINALSLRPRRVPAPVPRRSPG